MNGTKEMPAAVGPVCEGKLEEKASEEERESREQARAMTQLLMHRRQKAEQLQSSGVPLYPNTFRKNARITDLLTGYGEKTLEELEQNPVDFTISGRVMALRSFGKAAFFRLQDEDGAIQVYVQRGVLPDNEYEVFKKMDIGDLAGITGPLFRTKTNELTIKAHSFRIVSKSMRPLPEKYHGLKDVETRYRRRYVDLIVNTAARNIFKARTEIVRTIRQFLDSRGFLEVETPMMQAIPGGATAKPFVTHHNALDMQLYMRIAPELYLKRLLVGGFERVYEIGRNFRNEGISTQHNPEFTMLEFYIAYADYIELMDMTEEMFAAIALKLTGSTVIQYGENEIDLTPGKWKRVPFLKSIEEIGGVPPEVYMDYEACRKQVLKLGEKVIKGEKLGKIQAKLFDLLVEPKLIQPHFIYHYPTDISPLSRRNEDNPEITDRFELFIAGREMANAFSELNDPMDQKGRFEEQLKEKEAGDEEAHFMDDDYVRALEYGMPPAGGEGVGIDRLVMLMTNSHSIREVILFPLLRPEAVSPQ